MERNTQIKPFMGGLELVFRSEVFNGELMDTQVVMRHRRDEHEYPLVTIAGDCIEQFYSEVMDTFERHRI